VSVNSAQSGKIGDKQTLKLSELEYLHEGTITHELAMQIAEQKYPLPEIDDSEGDIDWEGHNRVLDIVNASRKAYALALTEIIKP
jgi:hypothetical protein